MKRAIVFLLLLFAAGLTATAKPLDLAVILTTDKTTYAAGQPVKITLTATNKSHSTADLLFGSGQSYDIFVTDRSGKTVWRWSKGMVFTMAVRNVSLPAGQSLKFSAIWKPARPGKYLIRGRLTSARPFNSAPQAITVHHR